MEALREVAVRVPCSTSNLGAGFDCVGLALRRYLTAAFQPGDGPGLELERAGTLDGLDVCPADDLIVRVFRSEMQRRGWPEVAGRLRVSSEIPVGRGLGSSAAAIVAAIALAAAAIGALVQTGEALAEAERWEGHPDNVAPALLGGLLAVVRREDGVARPMRLGLSEHLGFAFAAPGSGVSTAAARAALPAVVPHAVAVRAAARMAALIRGLGTGDEDALRIAFADELHVPYRLPLIPRADAVLHAARDAGAYAVTISGSGSGLIAACAPDAAPAIADAMRDAFGDDRDEGIIAFAMQPDFQGARRA